MAPPEINYLHVGIYMVPTVINDIGSISRETRWKRHFVALSSDCRRGAYLIQCCLFLRPWYFELHPSAKPPLTSLGR